MTSARTRKLKPLETVTGRRVLGISAILLFALIVVLATVRPNPFGESRSVYARFDSAQGLGRIDRNVRVGGTNAGQIGTVERDGDDVVIELELDPEVMIHNDARVELRPHTLFEGSAFVDLHPGSPSAPAIGEEEVIPTDRTNVYVSLDDASRVFREPNRKALRGLVLSGSHTLSGRGIDGLRKTFDRAPGLVRELGPTARALRGPEGDELSAALQGMSKTVDALATREQHLGPIAERTRRTFEALDTGGGAALDATLRALPGPLEELEAGGADLEQIAARLDELSVELTPAARELAPLLRDSRPLLRRSVPVIRASTPLVSNLRTVLARMSAAAPALHKVVKNMAPGAKILDESVLPFLTSDSKMGVPVYAQLVAAFTAGDAALRPYETSVQGSLGQGHVLRLGALFDAQAQGASAIPSCATIGAISEDAASQLEALGLCTRP